MFIQKTQGYNIVKTGKKGGETRSIRTVLNDDLILSLSNAFLYVMLRDVLCCLSKYHSAQKVNSLGTFINVRVEDRREENFF